MAIIKFVQAVSKFVQLKSSPDVNKQYFVQKGNKFT